MKDHKKADEIAVQRVQLLSPLLVEGLDGAKVKQLKSQICEETGISERTIRRYLAQYINNGFDGLKPKGKGQLLREDAVPPEILDQAILLRREVPNRSIAQIIQILEWDGLALPGQIKRSTLQEKLSEKGYSSYQMKMYAASGIATRRFQRKQRNSLWHSDIKYGPYLPIGPNGEKKQVYMVAFMDDATRYILHTEFYPTLNATIVEDCFRKTIMKYGIPGSVYFDNGKQYRNKWMKRACSKIGVKLVFARPYSPESTGKIERFNRVVDSFLDESYLEKPKTLDQLNQLFNVWIAECYQNKSHSALKDAQSPSYMFKSDPKALNFIDAQTLTNAFLHFEERKVDKSGCISFESQKYEVGVQFAGFKVDVIFDPTDTEVLTIEYENCPPFKVRKLQIGERTAKKPTLPERLTPAPASSSRLLQAATVRNQQRNERVINAISYHSAMKEGGTNV